MVKTNVNRNQMQLKIEALEDRRLMTFNPAVNYGVGANPVRIVSGGFRPGSSLNDIAVTNYTQNQVTVLPSKPGGTFGGSSVYSVGNSPHGIASGDLNCNGSLDLLTTNYNGANLSAIYGTGGRRFFPQALSYQSATGPVEAIIADFTGDGKPDIITAHYTGSLGSNTLRFSLGNCSTSFGSAIAINGNGTWLIDVETADLNQDGKLDLVVTHDNVGGPVGVLLGNGNGTFSPPTEYNTKNYPKGLALGDINADGAKDILIAFSDFGEVGILLGNGNGTFQSPTYVTVGSPTSFPEEVVIADFGNYPSGAGGQDSLNDFAVVLRNSNAVAVCYNSGSFPFYSCSSHGVQSSPRDLVATDFSGDGLPDIATANYNSGSVSILINTSSPLPPPIVSPRSSVDFVQLNTPYAITAPEDSPTSARRAAAAVDLDALDAAPISVHPQRAIHSVALTQVDIEGADLWSPL